MTFNGAIDFLFDAIGDEGSGDGGGGGGGGDSGYIKKVMGQRTEVVAVATPCNDSHAATADTIV